MFFQCVEYDVEECDSATCILGKLFHIEQIVWDIGGVEVIRLLVFEYSLDWSALVQHHDSKDGLRDHFQCPILNGQHFLEGKLGGFQP